MMNLLKETPMSDRSAVSMQELELESAELLPSRETLCVAAYHPGGGSFGFAQTGLGNTAQGGLLNIAILNGTLNNLSLGPIIL
jgi:hypothetical protein